MSILGFEVLRSRVLGFRVSILGFEVLRSRVLGFRVSILGFEVLRSRVLGFRVSILGFYGLGFEFRLPAAASEDLRQLTTIKLLDQSMYIPSTH